MSYKSFLNPITASLLFALAIPALLICMLVILLVDWQNPIFIQERFGFQKKKIRLIKLRTMKNNEVTRFGLLLRKTGLDEIPQLLNIIFGQVNFVGPRPLTEFDVDRLNWADDYHAMRWNIKPGLTGLAQLSLICNKKMSWFLDLKYLQCHNFWLDIKIIFASCFVPILGKKRVINLIRK